MNHDALIRHLSDYASSIIAHLPRNMAISCLRGNIPYWREVYGADVAAQMGQIIKRKLGAGGASADRAA